MTVRILAVDPGYDRLGWSVGEVRDGKLFLLAVGLCHVEVKTNHLQRLRELHTQLAELFKKWQPQVVAQESLIFARNISTALPVSEVRGLLFGLAFAHRAQAYEYPPSQIKLTVTGNGQADKKAIQKMIELQFSKDAAAVKLFAQQHHDDVFDAVAVLLTHVLLSASAFR